MQLRSGTRQFDVMRRRPTGSAGYFSIDQSGVGKGIVFAQFFTSALPTANLIIGGTTVAGYVNGGPSAGKLGRAMVGNTVYWGTGSTEVAGNTFAIPQTQGTVAAFMTTGWASNDGVAHYLCAFGRLGPLYFDITKYSDNNLYSGWVYGADTRATASAASSWAANDSFVLGVSWSSAGTSSYVKGSVLATNGSAPTTGNTALATSIVNIGDSQEFGVGAAPWMTTSNDALYYFVIWNRALSAQEWALLNARPWSIVKPVMPMWNVGSALAFRSRSQMIA